MVESSVDKSALENIALTFFRSVDKVGQTQRYVVNYSPGQNFNNDQLLPLGRPIIIMSSEGNYATYQEEIKRQLAKYLIDAHATAVVDRAKTEKVNVGCVIGVNNRLGLSLTADLSSPLERSRSLRQSLVNLDIYAVPIQFFEIRNPK